MATTWFIQRNEKSVGPLSGQQLRELAVSGKLRGDDLVRKDDAVEFAPASRVKSLFVDDKNHSRPVPPPPRLPSAESQWQSSAATTSELSWDAKPLADSEVIPPSASDDLPSPVSSWPHRLLPYWTAGQNWLKEFGNQASQAGELGKLYALQARIQQIQLPQAYAALGTDVYSERRFADAFTTLFSEIDEAVSQQSALATPSSPERESDDLKGRVKSAADGVLRRGKGAQLGLKVRSLQNKLGEAVYVKHGKDCGQMQLIAPIEAAQQELQRLQQRIDDLAAASTGKTLTPKRLLVGGGIAACTLLLMVVMNLNRSVRRPQQEDMQPLSFPHQNTTLDNISQPDVSQAFIDGLPPSIESGEFRGKRITIVGLFSSSMQAHDSNGDAIEKKEINLATEYENVFARCWFSPEDGMTVGPLTDTHSQFTVTGTLVEQESAFAGNNKDAYGKRVHRICLDDCTVIDMKKRGEESIVRSSKKLRPSRIRMEGETFMEQLAVMRGLSKDSPLPPRQFDKHGAYFHDPRYYYKMNSEIDYDEWVEAFGEPFDVRLSTHEFHEWQQHFRGHVVHVAGVLKTPIHHEQTKKYHENISRYGNRQRPLNEYEDTKWKVVVFGVSVD